MSTYICTGLESKTYATAAPHHRTLPGDRVLLLTRLHHWFTLYPPVSDVPRGAGLH